jgi:hypothetical protein
MQLCLSGERLTFQVALWCSQRKSYNMEGFKELIKQFEIANHVSFMLSKNQGTTTCKARSFENPGAVIPTPGFVRRSQVTSCSTLILLSSIDLP